MSKIGTVVAPLSIHIRVSCARCEKRGQDNKEETRKIEVVTIMELREHR